MTITAPHIWPNMQAIKDANAAIGHHFFDGDTMRFWSSIVYDTPLVHDSKTQHTFFITSERDRSGGAWNGRRRYTIRAADIHGRITDASKFGEHATLAEARRALRHMQWSILSFA